MAYKAFYRNHSSERIFSFKSFFESLISYAIHQKFYKIEDLQVLTYRLKHVAFNFLRCIRGEKILNFKSISMH